MFPQASALYSCCKICAVKEVVVVLPFVPVIAIKGLPVSLYASSTSEITGIFSSFKRLKISV